LRQTTKFEYKYKFYRESFENKNEFNIPRFGFLSLFVSVDCARECGIIED